MKLHQEIRRLLDSVDKEFENAEAKDKAMIDAEEAKIMERRKNSEAQRHFDEVRSAFQRRRP